MIHLHEITKVVELTKTQHEWQLAGGNRDYCLMVIVLVMHDVKVLEIC
jgi:hypothetical protein